MTTLVAAVARLASRAGVRAALVAVDGSGREAQSAAGARAASIAGAAVLGHADDGRPVWADGVTGSIAHTDCEAIAVAADSGAYVALGVDVEQAATLSEADAALVLDEQERTFVRGHHHPDWAATLVWSAKESAFKAWSTATDGGLGTVDPVDIHVRIDARERTLSVGANGALGVAVQRFVPCEGFYEEADGRIVTLVALRDPASG